MEKNIFFKTKILPIILVFIVIFAAGMAAGMAAGYIIFRPGPTGTGETDREYYYQYGRTTEIIGRIENELERERELNRELREHNLRAREIAGELTGTAERNVRNLQDAISLIGEIRRKLQILADFYCDSDSGNSNP